MPNVKDSELMEALDVVNCARSFAEVEERRVYICPAQDGQYSHKRCRYFGAYREKGVEYVAEIEAVIDVHHGVSAEVLWINGSDTESRYCERAVNDVLQLRRANQSWRVFLLGTLYSTDFVKHTDGGLQRSNIYLDVSQFGVASAEELATRLTGASWSNYQFGLQRGK